MPASSRGAAASQLRQRMLRDGIVARTLFRALLKGARAHERNPALKALMSNRRTRVYDRKTNAWADLDWTSDAAAAALHSYTDKLFGDSSAVWYSPQNLGRSCSVQLVRRAFREGLETEGWTATDRLDVAFAALRQLESNLTFGRRVLSSNGAPSSDLLVQELKPGSGATGWTPARRAPDARLRTLRAGSTLARGGFLLSHPLQCSSAFWRTLLLVCEYDANEGSMALVVNRPTGKRFGDVVTAELKKDPFFMLFKDHPLFCGGPVHTNALFFLHMAAATDSISAGMELKSSADVELLITEKRAEASEFRVFCGYTGWGCQQLEGEIEEVGGSHLYVPHSRCCMALSFCLAYSFSLVSAVLFTGIRMHAGELVHSRCQRG